MSGFARCRPVGLHAVAKEDAGLRLRNKEPGPDDTNGTGES